MNATDSAAPVDPPQDAPPLLVAAPVAPVVNTPDSARWHLTFEDTFQKVDFSKWNPFPPWGKLVINSELGTYLPANLSTASDGMTLTAMRGATNGTYSTGEISSHGTFSQMYGYFEIKAKLPKGNGFWPAFWLMPLSATQTDKSEIDIFEVLSENTKQVHQTMHFYNSDTAQLGSSATVYTGVDTSTGYHVYGLDWRPDAITWYVDGQKTFTYNGKYIPNEPFYIIANLAVGGSWPVPVDSTTPFPAQMKISYIRAWQYEGAPEVIRQRGSYFETLTADKYVVAPGETLNITTVINVQTAGNYQVRMGGGEFATGAPLGIGYYYSPQTALQPGLHSFTWQVQIPTTQAPGGYVLSSKIINGTQYIVGYVTVRSP